MQAAYNGVDRLYFHQGTIGNCQYCFWGRYTTGAPFYGVWTVSQFLGTDGSTLAMLDDGTSAVASYVVFNSAGKPLRALIYNSAYYGGSGTRSSTSVTLTGLSSGTKSGLRLTAPASTSPTSSRRWTGSWARAAATDPTVRGEPRGRPRRSLRIVQPRFSRWGR